MINVLLNVGSTKITCARYFEYILKKVYILYDLVPGDGGSQFEAKLNKSHAIHRWCYVFTEDWFPLWLNIELLAPGVLGCTVDNLRYLPFFIKHLFSLTLSIFSILSNMKFVSSYPIQIYYFYRVLNYSRGIPNLSNLIFYL